MTSHAINFVSAASAGDLQSPSEVLARTQGGGCKPPARFLSGLRRSVAAVVAAFLFAAALLGNGAFAAEHAKAEAKAEAKVEAKADAHHGHNHGPAGHPTELKKFGYAYLTAYMFCLSFCLGALFLVILNHLFDAQWMLPIRRFLEHIACLSFPTMAILWIPIGILAPQIYPWMTADPATDHALAAKLPLFTVNAFYGISLAIFFVWWFVTSGLRRASLAQDKDGSASHTRVMRRYAAFGIFAFAFSLTGAAIFWMKALSHQFFSTMYGVVYFAGSVWVTVITTYWLLLYFRNRGDLKDVTRLVTFHDCGVLFLAFTVFYAYIHFSQYFLIWNAAMPEETFWYVAREQGTWKWVGYFTVFGHFWMPFLLLLPIHRKLNFGFMSTMAGWAWLCHYMDLQFNIGPVLYPDGLHLGIYDVLCLGGLLSVLVFMFSRAFNSHPPYPQRDPRVAEAMGVYVEPTSSKAAH